MIKIISFVIQINCKMGKILSIETSTDVCSVAIAEDGVVTAKQELFQPNSHSTHLTLLIQELFKTEGVYAIEELDAVAVSAGPGSYTGLRIGVSVAKGICYAQGIPLIAIDTLMLLTQTALSFGAGIADEEALYSPMIDARRMEVYTSLHNSALEVLEETNAKIIDNDSFSELLQKQKVIFFGNGASKCKSVITSENASFLDNIVPLAANMSLLAESKLTKNDFVDLAYFEPFYLKSFVATIPKKKFF